MLGTPAAGVGRVGPDDRDPTASGHADQPDAETAGGDAGHGAAQPFAAGAAAQAFTSDGAGVGEIQILHHDRAATVVLGVVEQPATAPTPRGSPRQTTTH